MAESIPRTRICPGPSRWSPETTESSSWALYEDALRYAGPDAKLVDLQGRFVMPGIIDAHTHPGLISIWADLSGLDETAGENEEPATPDRMPSRPREATLAWLQQYADDHPFTLVITQAAWDVAAYLPDGPHKKDLDEISSVRPILLYDNSGHSFWVNSAMLRILGIDRNTPDLSENLSYFVRDFRARRDRRAHRLAQGVRPDALHG